jgi:integrase
MLQWLPERNSDYMWYLKAFDYPYGAAYFCHYRYPGTDVPIETVSQLLGHKSIKATQIYAKVSQKK